MNTHSLQLFREVLAALARAWRARHAAMHAGLDLPPVREHASLSSAATRRLANSISGFVKILLFWKLGQCCLYRCYVIACVLRTRGVPVILNIGLLQPANGDNAFGHCWLTLNGEPFAEKRDPRSQYPIEVARTERGLVYWLGPAANKRI